VTDWTIIELDDPSGVAKLSLPPRIPAPADAPELQQGGLSRALVATWAERFRAERPDDPLAAELGAFLRKEPLWRDAEERLLAEDWPVARALLERILALDAQDAPARFNLAAALRGLDEGDAALAELERIRPVFADEGLYHANLGRTFEALERPDDAVAAYRRALELLPDDAFLVERLVALGDLVPAQDEEGNDIVLTRADFADGVREDLAQHSDDATYLVQAADALLGAGQADLALSAAELALAAAPGDENAVLLAGVALAQLGQLERALARLDAHVDAVPASLVGHGTRAQVLHGLGRLDEAEASARRTLELDPNQIVAVQVIVARDDGPEPALGRTLALAAELPHSWAVRRVAGDIASTAGDDAAALAHWQHAIELGADDATLATVLGELGRQGRVDELCEIADGITRLSEREPGLRWNIASGYAEAGRTDEARIVFASIAHDGRVPSELRAAAQQRATELS
jgi:tetratricopeptide (TPR) repeat protein